MCYNVDTIKEGDTTMKNKVMKEVKNLWTALNTKAITEQEYIDQVNKVCDEYGTEYVAQAMLEMTKRGEWKVGA